MKSTFGGLADVVAKAPIPYSQERPGWFGFGGDTMASAESSMKAYGRVSTLFSIIRRRGSAISGVDWELMRRRDGRGRLSMPGVDDARRVDERHPAAKLWNKPNPFMTRKQFTETAQQHLDLVGETVWIIVRASQAGIKGMPIELWPIRPDRIEPIPHPTEFISGWIYTTPKGQKIPFPPDDIIQVKLPNPLDPYRGMGPVQSLMIELDTTRASAEWNLSFFRNSAEPGGIIEAKEGMTDHEFRQFHQRWNEQHRGVHNAHRVAIIEHGVWKDRAFSQRDMQFVELRHATREMIWEAFGISKTMLGLTEDVNRATAEAAEYVFAKYHILDALTAYKEALNELVLPQFGAYETHEFDHADPVPEDHAALNDERDSLVAAVTSLINAGFDPVATMTAFGLPVIPFTKPEPAPPALAEPTEETTP